MMTRRSPVVVPRNPAIAIAVVLRVPAVMPRALAEMLRKVLLNKACVLVSPMTRLSSSVTCAMEICITILLSEQVKTPVSG